MTTLEVAKYIYDQLTSAGATKEGACAVLGNIQAESAFVPNNLEDTKNRSLGLTDEQYTQQVDDGTYMNFVHDAGGYGLPQWTYYTRKSNFLKYAKSKGKSIGDLQTQVEFLIKEMKESYSSIWNQLRTSNNLYNLTWILLDKWENPAVKNISVRYQYAQSWYNQMPSIKSNSADTGLTLEEAVEKVLDTARADIGYHEGANNYIKYATENWDDQFYGWNLQNQPWCDVYVDYCFIKTFGMRDGAAMTYQTIGNGSALCSASAAFYRNNGAYYNYPEPGDQVFFQYSGDIGHTGIVESVNGSGANWTSIVTIEGNTSDQVARRYYNRGDSSIHGFGRPKWSVVTGKEYSQSTSNPIIIPTNPTNSTSSSGILRKGAIGNAIKELQQKLIKLGYDCGPDGADGDFGKNTLAAVLKFQSEHNLVTDGEVGPLTLTALDEAYAEKQDFKVGDIVNFVGNTHYTSAIATKGYSCTPGKAKVTMVSKNANTKHPYHVVHTDNKSSVYGWVDANKLQKI